ncbi:hypothetical protein APR04_001663 [Promicromonospora umidemergens]|uniref:DUF3298 domain-containing protein n=1 Tax=Promicromonospora umidemergens TaxID=629679 RepID=A0ABP8Y4Q6_9MICO|nr:hypothetical protein [Promicromonospora umidemergens]MCP2282765.1 hypothetical protein [Promicromonospora umidemergens]
MSTETEASGPGLGAESDDGPADLQAAAAASFRAAATSWAFVYPRGWWTVPLTDTAQIDGAVRKIVVGRLGRRDDRARARREAREYLSQAAHGAAEEGGLSLAVFSMDVGDVAITGTMAVFTYQVTEGGRDELIASITGSTSGADVDKQKLDDGWVLRAVRQSEIERTDAEGNPMLPELRADYWTERRGLDKILQVSFTTPFVPLREAMLELFDAIVLSLHPVVRG